MNAEAPKDEKVENEENTNEEQESYELSKVKVDKILDEVKAGDSSLNKLKVQNLDFILDIPLSQRQIISQKNCFQAVERQTLQMI